MFQIVKLIADCDVRLIDEIAEIASGISRFKDLGMSKEAALKLFKAAVQDEKSSILVALHNKIPVGFIWIQFQGTFGAFPYLNGIAVKEDFRRFKLGTLLLKKAEEMCMTPYGLFLLVAEDNDIARKFFETNGYKQKGMIDSFLKENDNECLYYKRYEIT